MTAVSPSEHQDLTGYWEAAERGELAAQYCNQCERFWWPPRPVCPRCQSNDYAWTALPDSGELFTWTVVHRTALPDFRDATPYAVGVVALPEAGIRIAGFLDVEAEQLGMGMPLRWSFVEGSQGRPRVVWS